MLDLGAGPGDTFRHLSGPVTDIVAVEPDPAMVRLALPRLAEGLAPVHLVQAVGERLPFPDEVFDTVVVTLVLCSVDDPHAVASEVHRVLRRGGRLLLLEHVRWTDDVLARWQDRLQPLCSLCNGGCHPNRPTLDTIRGAGLRIGSLRAYGFPVLPYVEGEAFRD